MRKIPRRLLKNKYKLLAYSSIFVAFGLAFYMITVPSLIDKKMYTYPQVQLNPDPIVIPPPSPLPPTPTPETLLGHKTYTSDKLNLKFEYATKIKAGTKIIPISVTEYGNTIYIHDSGKGIDKSINRYIEVSERNFRDSLEQSVKKIFIEKPQYCRIFVSKTGSRADISPLKLNATEIATVQATVAVTEDGGVDHEKSKLRQQICGYNFGFFTFDQKHPDKLLFIRPWGLNGDVAGVSSTLHSNIIENDKNLYWESTIDFVR